jgi:hypothetical protein
MSFAFAEAAFAVEKDILRRKAAMGGATVDDLQAVREQLQLGA